FPDLLHKAVSAKIMLRLSFCPKPLFNDVLRCYPGVVRARQPKNFFPQHSSPARQNVLDRVIQYVTHRKYAGYVRRGDDDGITRLWRVWISLEAFFFQPDTIPFLLHRLRFVGGRNLGAHGKRNLMRTRPRRNGSFAAREPRGLSIGRHQEMLPIRDVMSVADKKGHWQLSRRLWSFFELQSNLFRQAIPFQA